LINAAKARKQAECLTMLPPNMRSKLWWTSRHLLTVSCGPRWSLSDSIHVCSSCMLIKPFLKISMSFHTPGRCGPCTHMIWLDKMVNDTSHFGPDFLNLQEKKRFSGWPLASLQVLQRQLVQSTDAMQSFPMSPFLQSSQSMTVDSKQKISVKNHWDCLWRVPLSTPSTHAAHWNTFCQRGAPNAIFLLLLHPASHLQTPEQEGKKSQQGLPILCLSPWCSSCFPALF